ncbi:MAG TPA: cupin domain-containing protein [Polyangiaceae bacterium]
MSTPDLELPAFLRDTSGEVSPAELAALGEFHRLLEPEPANPEATARLLSAVEALPLRYAPFFARIAALWDLPEADVVAILDRSRDPEAWRKSKLPGLRLIEIPAGERCRGADVHLVRFSPGMRFPRHRHPGAEALFVLEGSYRDTSGRVVGPGDLHEMLPGSEHGFLVAREEPCIAASVQYGREFTGFLMRILVRVFG